ncbi:WhiB family transcriptional regulator [Streptomyces sp. ISL-94]|uniref:WhiB family transcriptional regulator n=1 Tax=Streptomyces sp. ISL-94 TaxID=2819190 RepID=UPI0027E48C5E|nr:WhiB family transcriptional regulator [Streptomyces sp. ISL-94]
MTWQTEALCQSANPAIFFPLGDAATNTADAGPAKAVCSWCPVLEDCLEAALALEGTAGPDKRAGIWGGCTPLERVAIHKIRNMRKAA